MLRKREVVRTSSAGDRFVLGSRVNGNICVDREEKVDGRCDHHTRVRPGTFNAAGQAGHMDALVYLKERLGEYGDKNRTETG